LVKWKADMRLFERKCPSATTRYQSIGGLYLTFLNQKIQDQRKLENIHLLCLVPHEAKFSQTWENYRKELKAKSKNQFVSSQHHISLPKN